MTIQQLTLWDEPVGKVWFDGSRWCATINDWWYAQGSTEADAVKRVTANYHRELEAALARLDNRPAKV